MRFKNNLQARILISVLSTVILVFVLLGIYVGIGNHRYAVKKAYEYIQLKAEKDAYEVRGIFNKYIGVINYSSETIFDVIQYKQVNSDIVDKYLQLQLKDDEYIETAWVLLTNSTQNDSIEVSDEWLFFKESKLDFSKDEDQTKEIKSYLLKYGSTNSITISEPYKYGNKQLIEIYTSIYNKGNKVGYIGFSLNLDLFDEVINHANIYKGGFSSIFTNASTYVGHYNPKFIEKSFSEIYPEINKEWGVEKNILEGVGFETFTEINDNLYYSYYNPIIIINNTNPWTVKVSMSISEIKKESIKNILLLAIVVILGLAIMILVIYKLTRQVIAPIREVTDILDLLSVGNLKDIKTLEISTGDELQNMGYNLSHVVDGLKKTESFAKEIGKGNLDKEYTLLGDDDQLGKALLSMRNNLVEMNKDSEKRKKKAEELAWATKGVEMFGDILRRDNDNIKKLGYNIISNMVSYLNANQGALFVLNDNDEENTHLELMAAIAYGRDKLINKEIKIGEGLTGRCAHEKKTIFLTEVPSDYVNITSGLGDAQPGCILIVPCMLNEEVFGVIELAAFTPLKPFEVEFIERLGESVGATLSTVRVNEKTSSLLLKSQLQHDELSVQDKVMRQNLEEMETTQEDLNRQMANNTKMREAQKQQNALLGALLNSLPDFVYFKDLDSKFINISKSMLSIFNEPTVDEVIGKSDFDYHTRENAQKYYNDEQNIIKTGVGITDLIQEELKNDGSVMWNSVTKFPLITEDGECIGTFGISRDITEIKKAQIEAHKHRELLDALLNSIPDYIFFKDKDSKFLRISKSMINIFNVSSVDEVVGKTDFDYHSKEDAQHYFDEEQELLKTGGGVINQMRREDKLDGTVLWKSVSKLPLITKSGNCIGTFGISKEVTKLKETELELIKQKEELISTLGAIKDSMFITEYDTKGIVIDANELVLQLLNTEKNRIIGTHCNNGKGSINLKKSDYDKFWAEIMKGKIMQIQNVLEINKKKINLHETYTPIKDKKGKVIRVLKIAFDIT